MSENIQKQLLTLYNLPESKVASSNTLLFPTNCPKPNNISTILYNREKQQQLIPID